MRGVFGNYNGLVDPKREGRAVAQSVHSANHLLASLGAEKTAALLPHLKVLDLPPETVLFETGDTIETVYFPLSSGVVSVVVDLANGEMIEAAMIGRDSLISGSAAFDNQISLNRVVVQVAGAAAALNVNRIRELAQQSEPFRAKLARHEQFLFAPGAAIGSLQRYPHARSTAVPLAAQMPRFARERRYSVYSEVPG
jgi:hypothetical protein